MTTVFVSATRAPGRTGHGTLAANSGASVLAHGVSMALTGSTISLVLALVVTLATVRRRTPATVVSAEQLEAADAIAA
jgi:hypothetical protein